MFLPTKYSRYCLYLNRFLPHSFMCLSDLLGFVVISSCIPSQPFPCPTKGAKVSGSLVVRNPQCQLVVRSDSRSPGNPLPKNECINNPERSSHQSFRSHSICACARPSDHAEGGWSTERERRRQFSRVDPAHSVQYKVSRPQSIAYPRRG